MKQLGQYFDGNLEGFNNSTGNYIGPNGSPHTIIHEILHDLSSKFDENGHRGTNGIKGSEPSNFGNMINEGLTDYLSAKISGEKPRHYHEGHALFSKLENSAVNYFEDEDILFSIYLNNRNDVFEEFLDKNAGKGTYQNLYDNYLFMNNEKVDNFTQKVEKGVKKNTRLREAKKIFDKFKNFLFRKKTLALPEGNNIETFKEKRQKWLDDSNITNYEQNEISENCNEQEFKLQDNYKVKEDEEGR